MPLAADVAPYRKRAIPLAVRRDVARKYGCPPGGSITVPCHYCQKPGRIHWHRLYGGRPSGWVSFDHQLDHVRPELLGGPSTADNLVLSCERCNKIKGAKV